MTDFMEYLAEETIALSGTARSGTVPSGATTAFLTAEGGAVYYSINSASASANSGGYLPDGDRTLVISTINFDAISFYGASGAKIHVQYYGES